jgi:sugar lactone lactonase YvrE
LRAWASSWRRWSAARCFAALLRSSIDSVNSAQEAAKSAQGARGICASPDGALIYVACDDKVQVYRVDTGVHVQTLGEFASVWNVGVSRSGEYLYLASTSKGVQQVLAADGTLVRTFCDGCQYGVGESPAGDLLYAADYGASCVHVLSTADGTLVRSIGKRGDAPGEFQAPMGLCVSPCGELLVVAEYGNSRVQLVRAATGEHVRYLTTPSGDGGFRASGVCMSECGQTIYCIDQSAAQCHVFNAAVGAFVRTICEKGEQSHQLQRPDGACVVPHSNLLCITSRHAVNVYRA